MQIRYLETSSLGLRWMKQYYKKHSQLNKTKAFASYHQTLSLLKSQPYSGRQFDDAEGVREISILGTAFSILYALKDETIFIIDIRDGRGLRSAEAIHAFNAKLREKYGL